MGILDFLKPKKEKVVIVFSGFDKLRLYRKVKVANLYSEDDLLIIKKYRNDKDIIDALSNAFKMTSVEIENIQIKKDTK